MTGMGKCIGRLSVLLDYYPSAQFAGLHVAKRMGLFAKRGLEVCSMCEYTYTCWRCVEWMNIYIFVLYVAKRMGLVTKRGPEVCRACE